MRNEYSPNDRPERCYECQASHRPTEPAGLIGNWPTAKEGREEVLAQEEAPVNGGKGEEALARGGFLAGGGARSSVCRRPGFRRCACTTRRCLRRRSGARRKLPRRR